MQGVPSRRAVPPQAGPAPVGRRRSANEAFHARFDAGKIKTLVTDGSPEIGSPTRSSPSSSGPTSSARSVGPSTRSSTRSRSTSPAQVRVVFKFYPLQSHPHGEVAARGAVAAMNQGKFWEMHHLLFENQQRSSRPTSRSTPAGRPRPRQVPRRPRLEGDRASASRRTRSRRRGSARRHAVHLHQRPQRQPAARQPGRAIRATG